MRRFVVNCFIGAFVACAAIEGLPTTSLLHYELKVSVERVLNRIGLWQPSWTVFTPEVGRENHHVEATIEYDDGTTIDWRTPDWSKQSYWQQLVRFRELEFFEKIDIDSTGRLHDHIAFYLERVHRPANAKATEIELRWHYRDVPPPADQDHQPRMEPGHHPESQVLYYWSEL